MVNRVELRHLTHCRLELADAIIFPNELNSVEREIILGRPDLNRQALYRNLEERHPTGLKEASHRGSYSCKVMNSANSHVCTEEDLNLNPPVKAQPWPVS